MKIDSGFLKKLDRVQLKFLLGSIKDLPPSEFKGATNEFLRYKLKDAVENRIERNPRAFALAKTSGGLALAGLVALFGATAASLLRESFVNYFMRTHYLDLDLLLNLPEYMRPIQVAGVIALLVGLLGRSHAVKAVANAGSMSDRDALEFVRAVERAARPTFTASTYATYKKEHSAPCKALPDEEACGAQPACEWRDRRCRASRATKLKYKPANPRWGN
jgi:hypothetical protein